MYDDTENDVKAGFAAHAFLGTDRFTFLSVNPS
jgi:hypothetical protein